MEAMLSAYGTLIGILPGIADMVGGEFDGPLVDGGEELLGEGDFGHDGFGKGRVESFRGGLVVERQIEVCRCRC